MAMSLVNCVAKALTLSSLTVNSIPKHNNVLCLGVIPKGTESETIYQITWDDSRAAAILLCTYEHRGKQDCECCGKFTEVLSNNVVKAYIPSKKFKHGQLPRETAMCDNFKGWGNFSNNALGIESNRFQRLFSTWNR